MLENVKRGEDHSTMETVQVTDDLLIDIEGLTLNKKELKNHILNSLKYSELKKIIDSLKCRELKRQLTEEA